VRRRIADDQTAAPFDPGVRLQLSGDAPDADRHAHRFPRGRKGELGDEGPDQAIAERRPSTAGRIHCPQQPMFRRAAGQQHARRSQPRHQPPKRGPADDSQGQRKRELEEEHAGKQAVV
jgi:hypothetical protein